MLYLFKEGEKISVFTKLCMVLLLCSVSGFHAQVFYSVNPGYLKSKAEQNNLLSAYTNSYPDTSITEQINFFPRNFMGNMGLASPDYIWRYGTDDIGFRFLQPPLSIDKFRESDVNYYRTLGPYASLTGIGGSNVFQVFKMLFTHTYRNVNVTLRLNRNTSKGFYNRQQTYTNNFYLSSNYTTRKKNAGYYLYILNNGNKNQENGGIADGVLTDSSFLYAKPLFKVNLSNANRDNREMKVMLNPWIRLNRNNDSLAKKDHYLQLKSKFSGNSYRYKDLGISSDKYYNVFYLDTLKTVDSSRVVKVSNELSYSLLSRNEKLGFSAGYRNEYNYTWQKIDSAFMNHILQSDLVYRTPIRQKDSLSRREQFFETHFNVQYGLKGPNSANYKVENTTVFVWDAARKRQVLFSVLNESRSADYIFNNWISNHFIWFNNGYKAQQQTQIKLGAALGKVFSVSVFNQLISNYLYFDQQALPQQYKGTISNLGLHVNFTKVFFRHLGIGLDHTYQNTSRPELVRVPQNISTAKLFYTGSFSKNILQLQIGAQIQVYDGFKAYAYMPSTQVFYLQDNFRTERYPYLDVYLSARIRPVSFFLKMENALQGLAGPDYAFVPGYYQVDRAFRFGLTWMFFD